MIIDVLSKELDKLGIKEVKVSFIRTAKAFAIYFYLIEEVQ
jgi:hypothetical protein